MPDGETLHIPAWYGEFGWEIMSWVPMWRKRAAGYRDVVAASFEGMQPLYADFVTQFIPHPPGTGRSLNYPKAYRVAGEYYRYGDPAKALWRCDILIHARGVRRKANINYRNWQAIAERFDASIGWIGTVLDERVPNFGKDLRGLGLAELTAEMAAAKLVVGCSSGVMHLAAACGADIVCWADQRTYFGETLEKRYKVTWNPHGARVGWLTADDWQPDPQRIISKIEEML